MKNKIIEPLSFIYIVFFLILMFNLVIKSIYGTISLLAYSEYIYIIGGVGLLLYIASKIKNFKLNIYEIIVFIMIILSCLSLINAVDIDTAIFGRTNRYEGLLVWLSYYIFILNAMNIKNRQCIYIIVSLISMYMLSNLYYALYQADILSKPESLQIAVSGHYASGFLGNSMFLGSLSCIFYGIVLGLFIKVPIGFKKYLLAIVLLIADFGIIINGSMSAIVGIIVINLVCLVQIIIAIIKKMKNAYIDLASLIIGIISFVLVFFAYTTNYPSVKNDVMNMFNQTKDIVVDKKAEDNYGSGRIIIWKKTIEKLKEAPITGYGIDNYAKAFDEKFLLGKRMVDKAHNDYLQKALCEGIISGMVFVIFLLIIFFRGVFSKLSPMYYGLFLAFVCYSVQAFFNVSFINVAPIYFIIIGLLIGKLKEKKERDFEEKRV